MSRRKKALSEAEIDELVTAQADDADAWGRPVHVRRPEVAAFSLPAALAARAAFFARLHRAANVEDWLEHIVQERIELEEAALAALKRDLVPR
ncbi:MAG TPA: hypothetical protein VF546_19440 [Pyrinomonadaceae bacterium]|jgi:hypothetical protein